METREYNIIFNKMNIKDSKDNNLITGPKFFKIINEFDPAHEDYSQYMAERKKRGLSTSRKVFCKEVLDNLEDGIRNSVITRINQIAGEFGTPLAVTSITKELQMITPQILEVENTVESEIIVEHASDSAHESIQTNDEVPPKVFISYAWGEKVHQDWVLKLSEDLRENGVNTILDKYEILAGRNLHHFMENSLDVADKVLIILTKEYKDKALGRTKGAGIEYSIITSEIFENIADNVKYIPILRGSKDESTPMFLKQFGSVYMKDNDKYNEQLKELLHSIFEKPIVQKSEIGRRPNYLR